MTAAQSRRAAAVVVMLLGVSLMAANHYYGHRSYLDRLNTARTLYQPAAPFDQTEPAPPVLARRVWVLILDGLREDVGERLPTIRRLGARGVRRTLQAEFPTFTYPNLTAMATGVPPFFSGVRLNEGLPGVPLDSIFDAARRTGLPASVTSWSHYAEALDRKNAGFFAQQAIDLAALLAAAPARGLAWIHVEEIDTAGHRYGSASAEYAAAAEKADALLGSLVAALDLTQDVLIALSDHGHRDRGGHGAVEPEVTAAFFLAVGAHVRQGVRLAVRPMRDVASTVAALAGLPPPRDNLGVPMLDLLDASPAILARTLAPAIAQRAHSDTALGAEVHDDDRRQVAALSAGAAEVVGPALAALGERNAQRDQKLAASLRQRRLQRLAWASLPLLLVLAAIGLAYRARLLHPQLRDLVPTLTFGLLFCGLYFARGYPVSWSVPRGQVSFIAETAIMGALAAVAGFGVRGIATNGQARGLEQASVVSLLWGGYLLSAAAAGNDPAWLESPRLSFLLVFLSTVEFYAAGLLTLLAASSLLPASGWRQS